MYSVYLVLTILCLGIRSTCSYFNKVTSLNRQSFSLSNFADEDSYDPLDVLKWTDTKTNKAKRADSSKNDMKGKSSDRSKGRKLTEDKQNDTEIQTANNSKIVNEIKGSKAERNRSKAEKLKKERDEQRMQRVEDLILKCEAKILLSLPLELYRAFQAFLDDYITRVSIVALAIHIGMLIPTIKYLNTVLVGAEVEPFIYLGPIVFIIPYAGLWLWENNFLEFSVFDDKLTFLVRQLKAKATTTLDSFEGLDLLDSLQRSATEVEALESVERQMNTTLTKRNEDDAEYKSMRAPDKSDSKVIISEDEILYPLYRLSYYRLFSKIDLPSICSEVQAIKSIGGLATSSTTLEEMDALLSTNIKSYNRLNSKDAIKGSYAQMNVASAAQQLVSRVTNSEDSTEETLAKLKELQNDLEKVGEKKERSGREIGETGGL